MTRSGSVSDDEPGAWTPDAEWPAVGYAEEVWEGDRDRIPRSRRMDYAGTYQAAVVPEIARRTVAVPTAVQALVEDAATEVARFDGEIDSEIAPLASVLLRSESAASSQIEHLTASAKAIAMAELGDTDRANASLIVANSRAMLAAVELADRLDESAVIAMHSALMSESAPKIVGRWRQEPVWIGTSTYGPHTASFVPPPYEMVPDAMADLVRYIARDDIPVIVQVAIAHAQFETIHPFPDGNGRIGRAVAHAMLRGKRLTRQVTLPVSAGLLKNVDGYIAALDSYRAGDPVPIIERVTEASIFAVHSGRDLLTAMQDIQQEWRAALQVRPQAVVWRALDAVIRHGVVDARLLTVELDVSAGGATTAIEQLVEIGALTQIGSGSRNRRFAAPAVLEALDEYARGIAHRT
jgi:Fic family protein